MRNVTAFVALVVACGMASPLGAKPPGVVMIISDDQGWTDFGFMGHEVVKTPHLDRLAAESVVFTRGYVPSSLCRPSLATLVTGRYPHQHKITSNDPPRGTDRREMLRHIRAAATLPKRLAERGYVSHQSGKWWEGNFSLGGFTHGMTHGDPKRGGRHGDLGLKIGRQGMQPIFDFIRAAGDKPFFVWYAPFMPHTPHTPPKRLLEKYTSDDRSPRVARYYAMCEWFDETVGELTGFLDDEGLAEDTLVLFVTDNGWIQNPKGGGYAPRSKRSPYDGGLRTPIMLRWPGKLQPRRDESTLVMSLDFAPTILAAAGIEPAEDLPGVNLLEVCRGRPSPRKAIFGECFTHDAVDIDRPASSLRWRWCIEGAYKLILPQRGNGRIELYNVLKDPFERNDLAAAEPDRVAELSAKIDGWWPAR